MIIFFCNQKRRKQIPNESLITPSSILRSSGERLSRELRRSPLPRNQISANYTGACCGASSVTSPGEGGSAFTRWHSSDTFTHHYPALMSPRRARGRGSQGLSEHRSAMCDL